jgi:hypothetical protein
MKIAKSKLAQIIQEEVATAMSESEQWSMGKSMKAVDLAADKGIVDAQDDFARIQAGGKVLQTDATEGSQEEEIAYAKAYHDEMDRLKQNVADRKLNRPPEPEGEDHDVQHYDGEFFQEGTNKMKITKSKLSKIIQEEVAKSIKEGMMDAIKNKLSTKRPAKAPYKRSANDAEAMRLMGVEDANDAMHITGAFRESPSSDDEDYMAGWNDTIQGANSAMQEGKNKIKITKSTLAQIVQEELTAMKAEGYGAYKRDDKNKKGLSPQYRGTDAASTDDTEDRFHKSEHSPYSDKKPKRGKKDLGEAEGRYEFELDPKVQQSVLQALAKSGTGALDFRLPLTPEQEKSYRHLDSEDRQSMLQDVVEELVELGKIKVVKVADGERESLYYAVQGLDEGGYDDEYDYGADEQAEEEYFSQALWDAVDGALEDWNGTPAPKHEIITGAPEGIDELDWDEMGEKYLSSLIDDGTVELRQGAPGDDWNGEEELYVLALR